MKGNRKSASPKNALPISDSITSDSYQYSDYYNNQEDDYSESSKSSDVVLTVPSKPASPNQKIAQRPNINQNISPRGRRPLPSSRNSTPSTTKSSDNRTINTTELTTTEKNTNVNDQNSPSNGQNTSTTKSDMNNQNSPSNGQQISNDQVNTQNQPKEICVASHVIKTDNDGPLITRGQMSFQVTYESKVNYWKRPICMTNEGQVIYCCSSVKDQIYGRVHIICTNTNDCHINSPFYEGMIKRNREGTRFTLLGKPNQNREVPQLAGIAFFDLSGKDRSIRSFRLALPTSENYYNFENKEKDLSRIAKKGEEVDGVSIYSSSLPEYLPNHKLFLDMGPYEKKRSLKNFMIKDKENSPMFIIFKVVNNMCKVKAREPITPIVAFALSVAAITSVK